MKYYLIAGEASGDLHGSMLIKALCEMDAAATVRCWGGELMEESGAKLVRHYRELAFMGFVEVIKHLPAILNNLQECKRDIKTFAPDALILIDYPGFNLRIASWAKQQGIKVYYYISPQVWAWNSQRVKLIRDKVERMFVILPFEKNFYAEHQVEVYYVGHPLLDVIPYQEIDSNFRRANQLSNRPIIALLPGSRKQEIRQILPVMVSMVSEFPDFEFVVAGTGSVDRLTYETAFKTKPIKLIFGQTYSLLQHAHLALVSSGTATLESALFNVPQVVCYKSNPISHFLARLLVNKNLRFISLVNLIADREIVAELIQQNLTVTRLRDEINALLNSKNRERILADYASLKQQLGGGGASRKTARTIIKLLKS